MRYVIAALLLATGLLTMSSAHAQSTRDGVSEGATSPACHRITLSIGLLPQIDAEPGSAQISGYVGSLAYANRVTTNWEVELDAALHDAEATGGESATVTSLLIGANAYPLGLTPSLRPYVTGALGPYVGVSARSAEARTETVLGARIGAGVDARLTGWLYSGLRVAYHAAPDFDEPVGTIANPRGVQLSLELGVTFGGR